VDAALGVAQRLGGATGRALDASARAAFVHGLHIGVAVGAVIVASGGILALRYLPSHPEDLSEVDEVVHSSHSIVGRALPDVTH
jgi:DHA2 family multidrug resistance protein-like MFS transporter